MPAHPHLSRLLASVQGGQRETIALVYPCERIALEAACSIRDAGIAHVLLVGPPERIEAVARSGNLDIASFDIESTEDDPRVAAQAAIELVKTGFATALMKGSLHTDELLGAVVRQENGLRSARRMSHVFLFDIPGRDKPLIVTDCVLNIEPDLLTKRDIAQNAIDFAVSINIARPRVAILSATESVNPALRSSLDAAALSKMAERGQIIGGIVDGPLAFDNAVSSRAAKQKGIATAIDGQPDILLVPNLDTGNALYKCLTHISHAECAGLVLGSTVPVILTSRTDSLLSRVSSAALASAVHQQRGAQQANVT